MLGFKSFNQTVLYKIFDSALNRHVSSESLTPLLFVMCLCGLGPFLSQDMFLDLPEFAFEGHDKKFTMNMLLTCILYCDAGPGCLITTVCKYSMLIRTVCGCRICHRLIFFGDAVA